MDTRHRFGHVFTIELAIACAVFALVVAALVFAFVRSRTRWGRRASQRENYPKVETVYVGVVAAVAIFVVTLSFSSNNQSPPPPAVRIQAVAFQWCWRFDYTGTPVSVTAQCRGGAIPTLVLPTGRVVQISLASTDVVHSFWVPYLRFKQQAFPDYTNVFTTKIDRAGSYRGECAEFCGLYHDEMDFTLKAIPGAQYDAWLKGREAAA